MSEEITPPTTNATTNNSNETSNAPLIEGSSDSIQDISLIEHTQGNNIDQSHSVMGAQSINQSQMGAQSYEDREISAPLAKLPSRPVSAISTASTSSKPKNLTIYETIDPNIPEDYIKKYKESFNMFANKEGRVSVDPDLPILMRGLLKNPSSKQITMWLKQLDVIDSVTLDEFLCIMRQRDLKNVDSEIELKECFRMFNKQSDGVLNISTFRNILQNIGEKELTDSEIEEMIRYAQDSENPQFVMYNDCIQQLVANIQPLVPLKKQTKKGTRKTTLKKQ